jgi:protein-tyrosine phosphatase
MAPDLFWIPGPWRGRLAVVARPRGGEWLADELAGWRSAGIDVVVSLLEGNEAIQLELLQEPALSLANEMQFVSFPIPDRGLPASTPSALALLASLGRALDEGKNVAVHCRQGIGRSGLIAAGVLAISGVPPEEATKMVSAARGLSVPETSEQRDWVQKLPFLTSVVTH